MGWPPGVRPLALVMLFCSTETRSHWAAATATSLSACTTPRAPPVLASAVDLLLLRRGRVRSADDFTRRTPGSFFPSPPCVSRLMSAPSSAAPPVRGRANPAEKGSAIFSRSSCCVADFWARRTSALTDVSHWSSPLRMRRTGSLFCALCRMLSAFLLASLRPLLNTCITSGGGVGTGQTGWLLAQLEGRCSRANPGGRVSAVGSQPVARGVAGGFRKNAPACVAAPQRKETVENTWFGYSAVPRVSTCNVALLPVRGTDVLVSRPLMLGSPVVRLSVESSGMASGLKLKVQCRRCRSDFGDRPLASLCFKTLALACWKFRSCQLHDRVSTAFRIDIAREAPDIWARGGCGATFSGLELWRCIRHAPTWSAVITEAASATLDNGVPLGHNLLVGASFTCAPLV